MLVDAAERVREGGARTVLISGEAGIGKTTLIAQLAREVCVLSGWDVFYGRCDEHLAVPFQPFPALVSRLVQTLSDDTLKDPQRVIVYHQAESFDALRAFLADPELQAAMDKSGVLAPPTVTFHTGGWAKFY